MSGDLDLGLDGQWFLQRILLADIGDLEKDGLEHEAQQGIARIRGGEVTNDEFESLLAAERKKLGGFPVLEPGAGWPTPIAMALAGMIDAPVGRWDRLVLQMVAAFEVLVKYLGAIAISDVLNRTVPEPLRDMFVESLERPSLGHWAGFLRAGVKSLASDGHPSYVPEMLGYYEKVLAKPHHQGVTRIDEFLTMRNDLAHGGLPQNDECAIIFADKFPAFVQLLLPAMFLKRYTVLGMNGQTPVIGRGRNPCEATGPIAENLADGAVLLQNPERREPLVLSPFVVYRVCLFQLKTMVCHKRLFLFYSDRKSKKAITLQDYCCGHWARDPDVLGDFNRRVPLADWRHGEIGRFDSLIEEKTRDFIGRHKEVAEVKQWMERNECGFCLIRGTPGVGKSALMSVLSQIGSDSLETTFDNPALVAVLRGDTWPKMAVIPYFIVRGEVTAGPVEFLSTLLDKLGRCYNLPCVAVGSAEELASELQRQLQVVSKTVRERGEKLLVLIDGLDESVSAEGEASAGTSLLRCIPRDVPPGVFVVLSGRRRREVDDLGSELRKVFEMELQGLNETDVQALLGLTISQFDVEADYVKQVTKLSQGNPLYLKLLLEALLDGQVQLNDIQSLPQNIQSFYGKILHRLLTTDEETKVQVLMVLALAREQFTAEQLAGITGQSVQGARRTIEACVEVVTERRNVKGLAVYRLFHDTFGDYMRSHKDYASLVPELSRQILKFAARQTPDREADRELLAVVERLFDGKALRADEAGPLSLLIEQTSRLLTGDRLMLQNLVKRPFEELEPLLGSLGRCVGPATARMTIDCLAVAAELHPTEVGRIATEFIERLAGGRGATDVQRTVQAARIAIEIAIQTCRFPSMEEVVRKVLLAACASDDTTVRSLGAVAVFRLVRSEQHALGMGVLQELGNRSVRFGVIRPRRLEVFAGCAIGLFYERPGDANLVRELRRMASSAVRRVWGLRLALWLAPKVADWLWTAVPDDYNNINPAEFKVYKKYAAKHPDLVAAVSEMIDFMDPAHGTGEEFARAVRGLDAKITCPEALLSYLPAQQAIEIRALAGEESALEAAYESWKQAPQFGTRQDFMYRLRIVQVGLEIAGQPRLGDKWTDRMETAIREFMFQRHGVYEGACHVYISGSLVTGIVFLAHQRCGGKLDFLRELVDWASTGQSGMLRWPETPRERQADAILLRVFEVAGVETGLFDPLARETVFFGMQCFLQHAAKFDDFLWERMATVLARMNIYHPNEVAQFLAGISDEYRSLLQVRMNLVVPKENVGALLSPHRAEVFYASAFSEPPGKKDGLRGVWQDCLRVFLGPKNLPATLRYGLQRLYQVVQGKRDGSPK